MLNDDCVLWDFLCGNGISFVAMGFPLWLGLLLWGPEVAVSKELALCFLFKTEEYGR